MGLGVRNLCNNEGEDQHVHSRRLISTFVIRFLESIIYKLAICEITFI